MPVFTLDRVSIDFPHPKLADNSGILACGGDLSVARLERAYGAGIFPWFNQNEPILWWFPKSRAILSLEQFHLAKSLRTILKRNAFEVKFNSAFETVVRSCAMVKRKGQKGTWINNQMIDAYNKLFQVGLAHSIEVYMKKQLVGGLYGVLINQIFSGESMFHVKDNASKIAFCYLVAAARYFQLLCIDCQIQNNFLSQFGVREIDCSQYYQLIQHNQKQPKIADSFANLSTETLQQYLYELD